MCKEVIAIVTRITQKKNTTTMSCINTAMLNVKADGNYSNLCAVNLG